MAAFAVHMQHGRELLALAHCIYNALDAFLGSPVGYLRAQAFKIALTESRARTDHERAVAADDMRISQRVLLVQRQHVLDHVHRDAGDQRRAVLALCHRVFGGHAQQHHPVIVRAKPDRSLDFSAVERREEGLGVGDGDVAAIQHLKIPVVGIERKIFKAAAFRVVGQPLVHLHRIRRLFGRKRLNDALDVREAVFDGGRKMHGDALVEPAHVDRADLADGLHAALIHEERHKGEDAHAHHAQQPDADG